MKTILVPTEHGAAMDAALDTALLLAQKFGSCIEGFPLRPAVADMVAMDPDTGLTMVAVKENDAEMVRQTESLFQMRPRFHDLARVQQRDAVGVVVVGRSQTDARLFQAPVAHRDVQPRPLRHIPLRALRRLFEQFARLFHVPRVK